MFFLKESAAISEFDLQVFPKVRITIFPFRSLNYFSYPAAPQDINDNKIKVFQQSGINLWNILNVLLNVNMEKRFSMQYNNINKMLLSTKK